MNFLNANHSLAVYETEGGEHGFLRYGLDTVRAEQPGFSSGIADRFITEAIFVAAEDADQVQFLLATRDLHGTLADLLVSNGVAFRYPTGTTTAAVTDIRTGSPIRRIDRVA